MQMKTVKNLGDIPFKGIEFVKIDGGIVEVVVGGKLRIRRGESYAKNLEVLIEAPFEEVERHRVTATIDGFDPKVSYHASSYEAGECAREYERKEAKVVNEKVTALVDDAGEVVGVKGEAAPADDEIAF